MRNEKSAGSFQMVSLIEKCLKNYMHRQNNVNRLPEAVASLIGTTRETELGRNPFCKCLTLMAKLLASM